MCLNKAGKCIYISCKNLFYAVFVASWFHSGSLTHKVTVWLPELPVIIYAIYETLAG